MDITKYIIIGIIILVLLFSFNKFSFFNFNVLEKVTTSSNANFSDTYTMDKSIKVSSISTDVFIKASSSDKIKVEFYKESKKGFPKINVKSRGQTLHINLKHKDSIFNFFNFGRSSKSELFLYIPENYQEKIDITNVSGDINFEEAINSSQLTLVNTSGETLIENHTSEKITIKNTSGNIALNNTVAEKIQLKSVSGEISCDQTNGETIEIESVSGSIFLDKEKDYAIQIKTLSGSINLAKDITITSMDKGKEVEAYYGDQTNTLRIETVSGNIDIE